jgi:CheY-like chemotaxis protein
VPVVGDNASAAAFEKDKSPTGRGQRRPLSAEAVNSLRGARLLLVEDNSVNREFVLEILANAGIRADVANNGAEALEMVGQSDYDGILMDCQMPVMDGFEATRKIRADGRFAELPIIAMTANAMASDREHCLASGMNDHIAKPIHVDQFFSTLAHWISPRQRQMSILDEPGATAEVPQLNGVDVIAALGYVNGDVEIYRKLLAAFRTEQADAVERIGELCRSEGWKEAARQAHTLRGLASSIGANQLVKAAKTLEAALRNEQKEALADLLEAVREPLSTLIGEIDRVIPKGDGFAGKTQGSKGG